MQIRFSELRNKEAYNGGGEPLGQIINVIVEPKSEAAYVVTMRTYGKNVGSSVVPVAKLKNIDGNEIIFAVSSIPAANFPAEYDSFLSDKPTPGGLNSQIYSLNMKKVLGVIYDYILDVDEGKRAAILIEERTLGQKRKFLVPTDKAYRAEDRAIGTKKILVDPNMIEQIA